MHCQTVIKSKNKFRSFVGPTTETRRSDDGAVRNKKRLPKWQRHPHALSILKDTTTPKPRTYEYDGNGNPTTYQGFKDFRLMIWDEENRLQGINDNGKLHVYTYDHTGERAVKSSAESQSVVTNGQTSAVIAHTENYTAYINPYFVVNKGKFTKHYFEGSSRIVSKLGEGTFQQPSGLTAGGIDYIKQSAKMQEAIDAYVRGLNVPPGPPTQQGIYASPEWTGKDYPSISWSDISQNQEPPEGWPRPPKFNEPGDVPGPPVQYGDPVKPDNVKGGFGFKDNGVEEKNLYFYHPDHLGSSSYITDRVGKITQHTEYIAFGEVLFDEHTTEVNMPYLFNGKELDQETGLYYYGARYYDARVSLWLNVDPLAEKYPFTSPYTYTNNNPVMLIDPDGREPYNDYRLARNGKIELIRTTNDKFDRLYNSDNTKYIKLNKDFMKNIRQDLSYDKYFKTYKPIETTIKFEDSSISTKQLKNYFYFLAANTEKEWGYNHLRKEGWFSNSNIIIINSDHNSDEVGLSPIFKYLDKGYDLLDSGHSHPFLIYNHPTNKHLLKNRYDAINYPSGFNSDGSIDNNSKVGDRISLQNLINSYGEQIQSNHWIYIGNPDKRPHYIYYDTASFKRK